MKVRHGFVSNSSTSSFVCDICKEVEAGRDMSLEDAEMTSCAEGHTFCNSHLGKEHPIDMERSLEEKRQMLLNDSYFAKQINAETEDMEIEDLYEDWKLDGCYKIASAICPLCQMKLVPDETLLLYLLKTTGLSKEDVVKQIREKFANQDQLKEFIKSQD